MMYERLYDRVLAFALRRVPRDRACEVADETFLVAWRRRAELPSSPLPWLLVTARNTIHDYNRREQRQDALSLEIAHRREVRSEGSAEAAAVERLTVLAAVASLPVHEREALMLTVWDGLPYRHAAVVAGCSVTAFTVRVHRARRRLADVLNDLDAASESQAQVKFEAMSLEVDRG